MRRCDKAGRCVKCMTFILTDVVRRCLNSCMPEVGGGTRLVTQPLYLLDFHLPLVCPRHYCRRLSVQHVSTSEPCCTHMAQWGARAHKTAEESTVLFHANVIATRRATAGHTCALGAVHSQTHIWTQSGSSS